MSEIIQLQKEWQLGQELASGGFANVYNVRGPNDKEAVMKIIPKDPGAERELLFEDLSKVPNVIPIIDSGEWNDHWVLVMLKAEKSLREHLDEHGKRLDIKEAIEVLIDIAKALVAIEGKVVHRDIKPENILLLDDSWCLADFGIARYAEATTAPDTRKFAMTAPYAAPEQWREERSTSATDIYATGIVAYEMLTGQRPFPGPMRHDYREQHIKENAPEIPDIPVLLQNLFSECLYKAPEARPRPQNFLERLRMSMRHASAASKRLQQAYKHEVEKQSELARRQSAAESEAERRDELFNAAKQSLRRIEKALYAEVVSNAPSSAPSSHNKLWPCVLNEAKLDIKPLSKFKAATNNEERFPTPFEVIAFSSISVRIPHNRHGYEGRSHSLWFCDAQKAGVFRWYETAFMIILSQEQRAISPFALNPGEDAFGALSKVMTRFQVAWPFTPIDQGEEGNFIERWIDWFADAASGNLHHPRSMPERNTKGSWRQ